MLSIQEQLGVMGISGRTYKSGKEILITCPFHDDKNPSCSVNLESGVWICYSRCGGGDWIQFIERVRKDPDYAPVSPVLKRGFNKTPVLGSLLKRGFNRDILSKWGIE